MQQLDIIHGDRRVDRRYHYPLSVRFSYQRRGVAHSGIGQTVDLSRHGVRFRTDDPLPTGLDVELRIAWPFLLQGVCPLELAMWGKVLRNDARGIVVATRKYEFRTCGSRAFHAADAPPEFCSVVA